ncbi:MAG: hypothetical protein HQL63_14035 [Magnetococcales bacterium]|nr:hypothetical protein [Magnetococcales bacterium]MBF0322470.1 hypothetical protein [Magnetococcales bacterium]
MIFLKTLLDFPDDIKFYLLGSDTYTLLTGALLAKLNKNKNCLGTIPSPVAATDQHAAILVSDKNWAAILNDLTQNGVSDHTVFLCIYVENCIFGLYDLWKDHPEGIVRGTDGNMTCDTHIIISRLLETKSTLCRTDSGGISIHSDAMNIYLKDHWLKHTDSIMEVAANLQDAVSKKIYMCLFVYNFNDMVSLYRERMFQPLKYVDCSIIRKGDVILDCGIAEGGEIPPFLALIGKEGQLHCVDPLGFRFLCEHARNTLAQHQEQVFLHEVALSEDGTLLPMAFDGRNMDLRPVLHGHSDGLQLHGCPSKTIDQLVAEIGLERLDLIKLSLCGSEVLVMDGVLRLMEKFRTQVIICISYQVADLWNIPLYFMEKIKNYQFFVRHYSFGRYETFLFMIPEEKSGMD